MENYKLTVSFFSFSFFFLFTGVPRRLVDYKRFGYGKSEFESETESVWVELHYGNVLGEYSTVPSQ